MGFITDEFIDEIIKLEKQIKELKAENARLKESINNKIQSHVNTCLARDHRINRLEAENLDLRGQVAAWNDKWTETKRVFDIMDGVKENLRAENAQLKHEFKMERQTGHELIEENARLSALCEDIQLEYKKDMQRNEETIKNYIQIKQDLQKELAEKLK